MGLSVQSLAKAYPRRGPVLSDVSFAADRGRCIGIYGDNGAGKSTLLRILASLLQPDRGEIFWSGRKMSFDDPSDRARIQFFPSEGGGFLQQLTGRQNLEFWFSLHDRKPLIENPPPALEQALSTPYYLCSSGMRQFLGLYKTLTLPSELLLLDEPFSHLDAVHRRETAELIRAGRAARVTVVSGHTEDELAEYCDAVYELKNGELV